MAIRDMIRCKAFMLYLLISASISHTSYAKSIDLKTPNARLYQYRPFRNGIVYFDVKAEHDAHIALTGEPNESHPIIEIILGGWGNTKSAIRFNHTRPDVVELDTPDILSLEKYQRFYISATLEGLVEVGREGEVAFLRWQNFRPFHVNYFGVCTCWGATGEWIIDDRDQVEGHPAPNLPSLVWVEDANGHVPDGAVQGGLEDGKPSYVIRAVHENNLIPGKLVEGNQVAYVAYEGGEHAYNEYSVLTGGYAKWVRVQGKNVPERALPAGETTSPENEGYPEQLYVCRVHHEGNFIVGKVHDGVCYIPYGGEELAFGAFEILENSQPKF